MEENRIQNEASWQKRRKSDCRIKTIIIILWGAFVISVLFGAAGWPSPLDWASDTLHLEFFAAFRRGLRRLVGTKAVLEVMGAIGFGSLLVLWLYIRLDKKVLGLSNAEILLTDCPSYRFFVLSHLIAVAVGIFFSAQGMRGPASFALLIMLLGFIVHWRTLSLLLFNPERRKAVVAKKWRERIEDAYEEDRKAIAQNVNAVPDTTHVQNGQNDGTLRDPHGQRLPREVRRLANVAFKASRAVFDELCGSLALGLWRLAELYAEQARRLNEKERVEALRSGICELKAIYKRTLWAGGDQRDPALFAEELLRRFPLQDPPARDGGAFLNEALLLNAAAFFLWLSEYSIRLDGARFMTSALVSNRLPELMTMTASESGIREYLGDTYDVFRELRRLNGHEGEGLARERGAHPTPYAPNIFEAYAYCCFPRKVVEKYFAKAYWRLFIKKKEGTEK